MVSGTPLRRPKGQFLLENGTPTFGPCQKLDFEVEFAAFIGQGIEMGDSIGVDEAEKHIFGFVLLNDWSARDIQRAEVGLMGPLNGKNFATSISPWVVPVDALEPYRTTSLLKVSITTRTCLNQREIALNCFTQGYSDALPRRDTERVGVRYSGRCLCQR